MFLSKTIIILFSNFPPKLLLCLLLQFIILRYPFTKMINTLCLVFFCKIFTPFLFCCDHIRCIVLLFDLFEVHF